MEPPTENRQIAKWRGMEVDEAAVEQLRRSYDVAGSEALRRQFEEQNSADEAQIEERRALLRAFRSEGKTAAAAAGVISSMQPIYSRIQRRGKMLRALGDLHKNFAKQVKSGEKDVTDAGKCKACDGMHRPHTCGKVGQVRVVERVLWG